MTKHTPPQAPAHAPPQAMSLFDLIGRSWDAKSAPREALFNQDGSAFVARLADGQLAFLSTKDAESPDVRMRQEVDTGRMSLRPREKPLPPVVYSQDIKLHEDVGICRFGEKGFAFVTEEGDSLWRATARGQTLRVAETQGDAITALAALPGAERIVVARGDQLQIREVEGASPPTEIALSHEVTRMAPAGKGHLLACFGGGALSLLDLNSAELRYSIPVEAQLLSIEFSPDASWLVAGCADKSLLLVKVETGESDRITQFPQPVNSVAFSPKSKAMLASGAFRIVGWTLPDLPFGTHEGAAIETGKPGLTVVERIAVHGRRDICAASYANGLVVACRAGQPDELMLHDGNGAIATTMAWSDDGKHLGWGDADGNLSIATFPKEMFK